MNFFLEIFARIKNVRIFAPVIEKHTTRDNKTVLWCNGNTSDSGPEIPGSSPGRTTKKV